MDFPLRKCIMKIAYVTPYDSNDPNAWSGAGYQIPRALADAGAEIVYIGGLRKMPSAAGLARGVAAKMAGKLHQLEREPSVMRSYSAQIGRRLQGMQVDAVVSPGTIAVAFLETTVPKIVWTDATFGAIVDYYPEFRKMTRRNRQDGDSLERQALSSCDLAVYNSEWAAESAISRYGVSPSQVKTIPFGSNFHSGLLASDIGELALKRQAAKSVDLLFVGTAWIRKGGDFALAVTEKLIERGVAAHLTIIGAAPGANKPWATEHGFLSQANEPEARVIRDCFTNAAFLIHPAIAECNANVFSEACSFGVPVLANRTGGIPTSIRCGENGHLFDLGESPERWADYIVDTLRDQERYASLCAGAFRQFSTRLQWPVAGASMLRAIEGVVRAGRCQDEYVGEYFAMAR
jgi:glycosyltransferase involved in cell wall biosynthesis